MSTRRYALLGAFAGATAAVLVAKGARIYNERVLERRPSLEGLDSPEVSAGFARVAALPQMGLLHRLAIGRALALAGGPDTGGRAIDLGCGAGQLAVALASASPGLQVTGIDLSSTLLTDAYRRAAEAGLSYRVDFRTGDAADTRLAPGSVDLVISTLSMHHWSQPVAVMNEVARILRPGGSFVIFDLRRDMVAPFYLLIWFASRYIVPKALRYVGEPMGSRNAAYTPTEAAALAQASQLSGWHVASGGFWLSIEGATTQ